MSNIRRDQLDTLAQTRKGLLSVERPIELEGVGIPKKEVERLQNFAKRKFIVQIVILGLIDVAKRKKKPEQLQRYWNTYHCLNSFYSVDGNLHGKYCKNRVCTVCSAIKKAEKINRYLPVVRNWKDCHFLTLTIKSIPAKELRRYFKGMLKVVKQIRDKYRKRGIILKGIRSLECNFNPKTKKYNPHFHIITNTKQTAEILKMEWESRFPLKYVAPWAQKLRPVKNLEDDMIETIKYSSKIFTSLDPADKKNHKNSQYVFLSALDNILTAFYRIRQVDRFGFNSPRIVDTKRSEVVYDYEQWSYELSIRDWVNFDTGELLTSYNPCEELVSILKDNIDLVAE